MSLDIRLKRADRVYRPGVFISLSFFLFFPIISFFSPLFVYVSLLVCIYFILKFIFLMKDLVSGVVVVSTKGKLSHAGITLLMEGSVQLQLSAKSIGMYGKRLYISLQTM